MATAIRALFCATLTAVFSAPALALESVLVGSGLSAPVFVTSPSNDSRLFVVERGGVIKTLVNGVATPYLDISSMVATTGERGLLGLAFDPGFASNGRFYVNYIDRTTLNTVVASFTAPSPTSGVADPNSRREILTVAQPAGRDNHKAGWIGFRPGDGNNLYIATGDGGSSNDPDGFAQSVNSNLGKILRVTPGANGGYSIPVGNPFAGATPGNDEIWSYGLRNPFRNSFDRQTGDFWIADVGQDAREEIDFEAAGTAGGRNYGWRAREGSMDNPAVSDPAPINATNPLFDYGRSMGGTVVGGYVYRGGLEPGLDGTYFFGDFLNGKIFSLREQDGSFVDFLDRTSELGNIFGAFELVSFGEDANGGLYAVGQNGEIYRIAAAVPEPSTYLMMAVGLLLLTYATRRRA